MFSTDKGFVFKYFYDEIGPLDVEPTHTELTVHVSATHHCQVRPLPHPEHNMCTHTECTYKLCHLPLYHP